MPHSGEALGVDAANLYNAGRFKVKVLADQFGGAATSLLGTQAGDGIFARDPRVGGSLGPAKGAFDELRDQVVGLLKETQQNMQDTGDALVMAALEYAATDEGSRTAFKGIRETLDAENHVPPVPS
ncbi:hypothetical protein AB0M54_37880 [Actinoplanes sp. NPDC051470]|uniref:hypothetical protein n=1 Tax=unclassified Actinoplanes TaxID=2626549 RepID=UPI00341A8CFE